MSTIDELKAHLKTVLSEKRYNHSIGTMERIIELAKIYNVDINKAAKVGLMHDVAKELTDDEKLKYIYENNIQIDETEKAYPTLLHGKIGAHICMQKYEFTEDMQNAIKQHTTGAPNMDMLSKILYIADKTEKNRTYPELKMLQELANKDINAAILFTLDYVIKKKNEEGKPVHINTILTKEAIKKEI